MQPPYLPDLPPADHPAVEDHGRVVTTDERAAAWYRKAQRASDAGCVASALRQAIEADPIFELAVADLDALTATVSNHPCRPLLVWERHHIEIVRTAAVGDATRAADLLREHLADVGCDPLAFHITAQLRRTGSAHDLQDFAQTLPGCHLKSWHIPELSDHGEQAVADGAGNAEKICLRPRRPPSATVGTAGTVIAERIG
jgi:hypothetical protein